MSPLVSIITVCYHEKDSIRSTCESVVTQKCNDFEWIIVDGGSTDGTLEILDEFSRDIDTLISESDNGIYDAMNKGINASKGEYLIFMNGGDSFASDSIIEDIKKSPKKDLIYGDVFFDQVDGKVAHYPNITQPNYLLTSMIPHQATFYRRELFSKFGNYDTSFKIAGDYELFCRLFNKGEIDCYYIPKPLAVFVLDGISNDKKYRDLRKFENHRIRKRYFPAYRYSLKALRQDIREFFKKSKEG